MLGIEKVNTLQYTKKIMTELVFFGSLRSVKLLEAVINKKIDPKNIENAIKKLNADIDFQYEVVEKTSKDFVPILLL